VMLTQPKRLIRTSSRLSGALTMLEIAFPELSGELNEHEYGCHEQFLLTQTRPILPQPGIERPPRRRPPHWCEARGAGREWSRPPRGERRPSRPSRSTTARRDRARRQGTARAPGTPPPQSGHRRRATLE